MELRYREIVLRDMVEADIDDQIRWWTVDTDWGDWDAPWKPLNPIDPVQYRQKLQNQIAQPKQGHRWSLEITTASGVHIGKTNSYLIDEQWNWLSLLDVAPGQRVFHTLGIDLMEKDYWGSGLGTQALAAFILHHLDHGIRELCLQTWSGNLRMVRCADKLGFAECHREVGYREVRGEIYDGLTFRLDEAAFRRYLFEENRKLLGLPTELLARYDARPGEYERMAKTAYDGEAPNYPICRLGPMDRLVTWCCAATEVARRYQDRGVDWEIVKNTLMQIPHRAEAAGLSKESALWLRHLYHGVIYRLGSLEFQEFSMVYLDREGCGEDYMPVSLEQKRLLPPGTPVINVHIPAGADLSPKAVDGAFAAAKTLFGAIYPQARAFVCYSWLLHPGLRQLLDENSNILRFAARFPIVGQAQDAGEAIRWIYGKKYRRKGDYPQETTLQRKALGHFDCLGEACGVMDI